MKRWQLLRNCCAIGTLWLVSACAGAVLADDSEPTGRELFDREWKVNDRLSQGADGLGPMFNARSCAACHNLHGSGGAGDNSHNVDLLTLVDFKSPDAKPPSRKPLEKLHPGFKNSNSIALHSLGTQRNYDSYRSSLLGQEKSSVKSIPIYRGPNGHSVHWDSFILQKSQRNTPSLFGAGVIDKISQHTLLSLAGDNPPRFNLGGAFVRPSGGKGQAATLNPDTGFGRRFGWKGQTATLKDFVRGACANELGLQTEGSPQSVDPTRPGYHSKQVDMTEARFDALVAFVASLPPPQRLEPSNTEEAASLERGSALFKKVGCLNCHVANVEEAVGIYSDLQLHDMGKELSEPVGPGLTLSRPTGGAVVVYYGPTAEQLLEQVAPYWRTPPLWGVRHTAPYLHDGRAATLDQAIKLHGGEAESSAARYRALPEKQREDLRAFVRSLGAL